MVHKGIFLSENEVEIDSRIYLDQDKIVSSQQFASIRELYNLNDSLQSFFKKFLTSWNIHG
jgi:hypothetical protein